MYSLAPGKEQLLPLTQNEAIVAAESLGLEYPKLFLVLHHSMGFSCQSFDSRGLQGWLL